MMLLYSKCLIGKWRLLKELIQI